MLSKSNIQKIINSFEKDLPKIFANEIVFAFLCGSLAKNTISENSDIDMFICLNKKDNEKIKIFLSWYKSIHKKYGLKPDHRFPGEVMDLKILDKSLKNLSKSSLQLDAGNIKFEDGLIWTGMLSGKNKAFVGKKSHFLKRKRVADNIIKKWRKQFLKDINLKEPDVFLKQLTQFYKSHNETRRHFPKNK
ncbi:MAG: nucleotidyltransferase domain-containing protein [Patescibacteria group bacterium]|nr:nucleotidyltransferase domain-containing protein [Patescibacteria group bacterium]